MKKRQIIIVSVGLLIIVGSFAAMSFLGQQREEPPKEKPVEAKKFVKTQQVKYSDISTEIVTYGRVRASESVDLISEQSGRMYQGDILLKEGQKFKKGDLIFRVDNNEASLRLRSQKSNFIRDLASIAPDLKMDFPDRYAVWYAYYRSIDLSKPLKNLPARMGDKERTFLATKNVLSSYYDIKSQEANLDKFNFYAPFDGSITEINLQSGSYVNPGNKIGHIIRSDKLEVKVDVPIDKIDHLNLGKKIQVNTEDNIQHWAGYISRISEVLNKNTQSIDVFIELIQNSNKLYDGQYLQAVIPGKEVLGAMEIPRNAIVDYSNVFIVEDSLLKIREIEVHQVNAQTVVFNGIEEGTDLVIEPLINASNNMKVFKLGDQPIVESEENKEEILGSSLAQN